MKRHDAIEVLEKYYTRQTNGETDICAASSKLVDAIYCTIYDMKKLERIEQIYSDYLDDMDSEKFADKMGEVF